MQENKKSSVVLPGHIDGGDPTEIHLFLVVQVLHPYFHQKLHLSR